MIKRMTKFLEEIFSSKNRIRIIKYLISKGEANITAIANDLNIHHRNIKEHLNLLEKYDIVKKKKYGRLTIYMINLGNPKVLALKRLLEDVGEI